MKIFLSLITTCLLLSACSAEEGKKMQHPTLDAKLTALFAKTKPVCFGRFLIEVPEEAMVVWGPQTFGAKIETMLAQGDAITALVNERKKILLLQSKTIDRAEINTLEEGPTQGSWTISFWRSDTAKDVGLEDIWGYFKAEKNAFLYANSVGDNQTRDDILRENSYIATHLRSRLPNEVPTDPGVCIDHGFIADASEQYQEIFSIGLRFPSMPDVTFSLSSNKNAQHDSSFNERRKQAEKEVRGTPYEAAFRQVKVLREGKHPISQWQTDEALFKHPRPDGGFYHQFQLENTGTQQSHNPNWEAVLYTGVQGDKTAEVPSSLSDEQAIALWDRLLKSLRLRVAKS